MNNLMIVFLMLFSSFLNAQVQVSGVLVNFKTKEPIPFASILTLNTFEGQISSLDGSFLLIAEKENQLFMFQCLGFETDTFSAKEIQMLKTISLKVSNIELSEVKVFPKDAFMIVRKAVAKIKENYNSSTLAQNVFFKEEIVANGLLMSVKEANFNALAKFKNKENVNLVSINKARYFADMDTIKSLGKLIEKQVVDYDSTDIRTNVKQFFNMDFLLRDNLGKSKTSLLGEKSLKFYNYKYNGTVSKDGYVAFHITFDQIDDLKKSLYKGHFYIDTASLAFIDIQIYTSPKGVKFQKYLPTTAKILLKLLGFKVFIKGMDYRLHYTQLNNKWVLDNAKTKLSAVVSKKDIVFDGFLRANFKVVKFYPKEKFYNKKSKYDKIESDYTDFESKNFWNL